ncbi:DUF5357 family protein [Roseofilum sp. Guam]|uniref:DUF5357 family protein n=1 Tax=Roseofilum sp. Guam TaxID=2821502 RepID=UPI001B1BC1A3|nr:DUF5357 family protein [Roseofilum sp. Guam]MBP0029907.1 DUF5357 family protein [Roseofilum sp. Guam]
MSNFIQLFKTLFSKPPTLWQILFMIGFGFWTIAALMPIFKLEKLQEPIAFFGFLTVLYALWIFLSQYTLDCWGIDFKPIIIWLIFSLIMSRTLDRVSQKVLWVSYPESIALTQLFPDAIRLRSLDLGSAEGKKRLQRNIIILLSSLLISCWIYFYFMIDEWAIANPHLVNQNMDNSLFVIKLDLGKLRSPFSSD